MIRYDPSFEMLSSHHCCHWLQVLNYITHADEDLVNEEREQVIIGGSPNDL